MFTFTLTDEDDEKTELKADSRDVLVWEKTSRSDERYVHLLVEMSMVRFYRLAHIAAKRQGLVSGPLKDFEDKYRLDVHTETVRPTNAEVSSET